jgi:beta-galactosidase
LNPRGSGFEAGEWALIDFHNHPSDRLQAAAEVSQVIQKNAEWFNQAQPIESDLHILYIREALWIERKLQRGGTHYEGREIGGVMKSALGYFETFSEMGLPCHFQEIDEFDFLKPDFQGVTIILAHQVSLPSRYWNALENFVRKGGKLIVDGLTAYYDENAHCIMKTGFPLEHLFGASIKEFKLEGNQFDVDLTDPNITLPGHCWRGTLRVQSATPIGFVGGEVTAVRNSFGKGEVVWMPTLLGLGARLQGHAQLSDFLFSEADASIAAIPFRFCQHYPGLMMKILRSQAAYITIIINKSGQPADVELARPEFMRGYGKSEILFADHQGEVTQPNKVHVSPEETLVIKWE